MLPRSSPRRCTVSPKQITCLDIPLGIKASVCVLARIDGWMPMLLRMRAYRLKHYYYIKIKILLLFNSHVARARARARIA